MATEKLVSHDDLPVVLGLAIITILLLIAGSWLSLAT